MLQVTAKIRITQHSAAGNTLARNQKYRIRHEGGCGIYIEECMVT